MKQFFETKMLKFQKKRKSEKAGTEKSEMKNNLKANLTTQKI